MSDTPITDNACGWPWGHHGRIECGDLKWSPDGPFVHSSVAREIERENAELRACVDRTGEANDKLVVENAALRAQDAWLVATFGSLEDENQKLRAELEAQAVVNGKGSEREAKLLAEVAALQGCVERVGAANDKLFMENLYLGKDKQRLDFLESTTGSGWASLLLAEGKWLTRKEIDRRMATEPKP